MSKKILFSVCLMCSDLIGLYLSLIISYYTRKYIVPYVYPTAPIFSFNLNYFLSFWWIPVIFLSLISIEKLYSKKFSFWESVKRIEKSVIIASAMIFSIVTLGKMGDQISRMVLSLWFLLALIKIPTFHCLTRFIFNFLRIFQENVLIIGAGHAGQTVAKGIKREKCYNYKIIGFIDDFKKGFITIENEKYPILGKIEDLSRLIVEKNISTVVLAIPSLGSEKIKNLFNQLREFVTDIIVVPDLKGVSLLNSELDYLFYEKIFLLKTKIILVYH